MEVQGSDPERFLRLAVVRSSVNAAVPHSTNAGPTWENALAPELSELRSVEVQPQFVFDAKYFRTESIFERRKAPVE
jgi:hypothetical protein